MRIMLDEGAICPTYAHDDDAGMDLYTPCDVDIYPKGSVTIDTGVHVQIPHGMFGKLESKSGLNVNRSIVSLGGVIDSGYTGSIRVKLYNLGKFTHTFHAGDKIVQMIVQPCKRETFDIVDSLDSTDRGDNGFGSTGR